MRLRSHGRTAPAAGPDALFLAIGHGVCLQVVVLVVRLACWWLLLQWRRVDPVQGDLVDRFRYFLPLQNRAQSTVLVFAAVTPPFVRWSVPAVEPTSAHAHIQLFFFHVLVVTTALVLDVLFFVVL